MTRSSHLQSFQTTKEQTDPLYLLYQAQWFLKAQPQSTMSQIGWLVSQITTFQEGSQSSFRSCEVVLATTFMGTAWSSCRTAQSSSTSSRGRLGSSSDPGVPFHPWRPEACQLRAKHSETRVIRDKRTTFIATVKYLENYYDVIRLICWFILKDSPIKLQSLESSQIALKMFFI